MLSFASMIGSLGETDTPFSVHVDQGVLDTTRLAVDLASFDLIGTSKGYVTISRPNFFAQCYRQDKTRPDF